MANFTIDLNVNVSSNPPPDLAAKLEGIMTAMSALTDQVDAALTTLASDSTNFKAALDALTAARDSVAAQLATAQAGEAADEVELQKALDALNAAHIAFSASTPPGGVTTEPSTG